MKKVAVVITARASYARVKTVLEEIQKHPDLELFLIATASLLLFKYGNAADIIENDGFPINEKVFMIIEGDNPTTMAKSVGLGIMELATIFDNQKPDLVISIADRFETICTAVAASYLNIPLVHIQGGEISGSIDEKVRHAVTKFASVHFVANEFAQKRVRLMGEADENIFVTGCPSIDLAARVKQNYEYMNTKYLYSHYGGVGSSVDIDKPFAIVLQHPVTTEFDLAYQQMEETIIAVHTLDIPALVLWPNVDAGADATAKAIRVFRENHESDKIHYFKNFTPEDFLALLIKARCIIGNSSVGIRECSFLGIPAVNIGSRQAGRERGGNVIDVVPEREKIINAVKEQYSKQERYPFSTLYGDGKAGARIAKLLGTLSPTVEKRFVE